MKVEEVLVYHGQLKGLSGREVKARARAWLDRFELGAMRQKKIKALSKGNQQKAKSIATVPHVPEIVIFDEPFSGFDPVNEELIREEMLKLETAGKPILLSSHRMDQVETLVDELLLLRRGRAVRRGTVAALKAEVPVRRYVLGREPAEEEAAGGRAAEAGQTVALPRDPE
ncbi:MAG: hypothetical protein KM296_00395 [Brockia lithotrophica]|nr:hypothetical protein [Brockia lithotrophica]